jgi:hypothetical protein
MRSHYPLRLQARVMIGSTLNVLSVFDAVIVPEQVEAVDEHMHERPGKGSVSSR